MDAYYITQTMNHNFATCDKMFMVQVIKHFLYKKRKVNQNIINILLIIIHVFVSFSNWYDTMYGQYITSNKRTKSGQKQVCVVICAQGYNITISFR